MCVCVVVDRSVAVPRFGEAFRAQGFYHYLGTECLVIGSFLYKTPHAIRYSPKVFRTAHMRAQRVPGLGIFQYLVSRVIYRV